MKKIIITAAASVALVAALVAPASAQAATRTPGNGQCTGTWSNAVANISIQRSQNGWLTWGFVLTKTATKDLGPEVTVAITYASVNGKAINPPYSAHKEKLPYNFHARLLKYNIYHSNRTGTIKTGDDIAFLWLIKGSTGAEADRDIECKVPNPGTG